MFKLDAKTPNVKVQNSSDYVDVPESEWMNIEDKTLSIYITFHHKFGHYRCFCILPVFKHRSIS